MKPRCIEWIGCSLAGVRLFAWLILAPLLLDVIAFGQSAPDPNEVLTTIAQIRKLSPEQAARPQRIQLRGQFIGGADPEDLAFVLRDETDSIYVLTWTGLLGDLKLGDVVEMEGVTDPGTYAPVAIAEKLRRIGHAPLPAPIPTTIDEIALGKFELQWVEVSGIVRSVEPQLPPPAGDPPSPGTESLAAAGATPSTGTVIVKLASGNSRLLVDMKSPLDPANYVDAEVRVRGMCFALHNHNRQFVKPFVIVPRGIEIEIVKPPPTIPLEDVPLPISALLQYGTEIANRDHRVHYRDTVVHHQPGSLLWLSDGKHSLRVQTKQPGRLEPGDLVDVLGFPLPGQYSPSLEDATFHKRGTFPPPPPKLLTNLEDALQNDANLVRLEALLTNVRRFPDRIEMTLEWAGIPIRAALEVLDEMPIPDHWLPGSKVEVRGICLVEADAPGPPGGLWTPRRFQLLLRSPRDLSIVHPPPWWNAERTIWLLAVFLLLVLAIVAVGIRTSRRHILEQKRQRAMAETEFSAILRERNRLAREIHDTLSQSLGAISLHLEVARAHAKDYSEDIRKNLGMAHQLTRAAIAESRNSIWNMRSQVLEECDLAEALSRILKQATDDRNIRSGVTVAGDPRRLSPVVENNLLRIGQEAINNAVKHARPRAVELTLSFEARRVKLTIADNGTGFDEPSVQARTGLGFGLVGIRERVELLGGTFEIVSSRESGTRIDVIVPD